MLFPHRTHCGFRDGYASWRSGSAVRQYTSATMLLAGGGCCRNMQALTSAVKNVLAPVAVSHENTCVQPSPDMRGTPLGIKAVPLSQNIVVQLVRLAHDLSLQCVHEVLCGILADELDSAPMYVLQQALSTKIPGQPEHSTIIPQASAMCVLANVQDLARAVKVRIRLPWRHAAVHRLVLAACLPTSLQHRCEGYPAVLQELSVDLNAHPVRAVQQVSDSCAHQTGPAVSICHHDPVHCTAMQTSHSACTSSLVTFS